MVTCSLLKKPTRLLSDGELEIATDALCTHGGSGTARALFFYRTGDIIDRRILHRLTSLRNNAALGVGPGESVSEADRLIHQMRTDPSVDYMMFYLEGGAGGRVLSELGLCGTSPASAEVPITGSELTEMEAVRSATNISPDSHMLLSVMWVRREERALFRCNPSVLFMDFTANTNVEKRPFFMGTGVTATNEGVVVFRAFTPNEKLHWTDKLMTTGIPRWMCLLHLPYPLHVVPYFPQAELTAACIGNAFCNVVRLLGECTFQRVAVGMGDECGNEIRSWQKGKATGVHRAVYRLCGLHKIHFGIQKEGFASQFKTPADGSRCVQEFAWWHHWFCKACESPAEEEFGRAALTRALASERFTAFAPETVMQAMQKWSDGPFFGNSHLLVHHHFMSREGGHQWTNCIGEGSNSALKTSSTGVKGTYGLGNTNICLCRNITYDLCHITKV